MKPTEAVPGKPYVLKMKKDEEMLLLRWLEMQDVYSDSIRFLIQKEIAENGLRNLQHYIPSKRTIESMREQFKNGAMPNTYVHMESIDATIYQSPYVTTARAPVVTQPHASQQADNGGVEIEAFKSSILETDIKPNFPIKDVPEPTIDDQKLDKVEIAPKKANKSFSTDVMDSYR